MCSCTCAASAACILHFACGCVSCDENVKPWDELGRLSSKLYSMLEMKTCTDLIACMLLTCREATASLAAARDEQSLADAQLEMARDGPVSICPLSNTPKVRVGPEDFQMMKVVGQGAFGKVFQVRYKSDKRVYAMKVMRKEVIMQKDHGEYVKSERDLLTAIIHPYIVQLRFSFQVSAVKHISSYVVSCVASAAWCCCVRDRRFGCQYEQCVISKLPALLPQLQCGGLPSTQASWQGALTMLRPCCVFSLPADPLKAVPGAGLHQRRPPLLQLVPPGCVRGGCSTSVHGRDCFSDCVPAWPWHRTQGPQA